MVGAHLVVVLDGEIHQVVPKVKPNFLGSAMVKETCLVASDFLVLVGRVAAVVPKVHLRDG